MSDNLRKSSGPFIGPRGGKWANSQHTIPYVEQKHAGKPAPKHREHDEHGANEIHLVADNSYEHHGQRESIHANLAKKIAAGTYDHAQAGKLFEHLANSVSKKYQKDHGSGGGAHAFDVPTRQAAARAMADQFHDEVKDGYHDHHVESGVHAKRAKAGGGIAAMASAHGSKPKGKERSGVKKSATDSNLDYDADLLKFYS